MPEAGALGEPEVEYDRVTDGVNETETDVDTVAVCERWLDSDSDSEVDDDSDIVEDISTEGEGETVGDALAL